MARNSQPENLGLNWEPVPGADDYLIFMLKPDEAELERFVEMIDAGEWQVHDSTRETQWVFDEDVPEGATFAVVAHRKDAGLNVEFWGDPFVPNAWRRVKFLEELPELGKPEGGRLLTERDFDSSPPEPVEAAAV